MFKTKSTRALVLIVVLIGLLGISSKSVAAPTLVAVGIYCISLGHQRLECHADVSGGTGGFSRCLNWTLSLSSGGNPPKSCLI
jgi:hypothetical protein